MTLLLHILCTILVRMLSLKWALIWVNLSLCRLWPDQGVRRPRRLTPSTGSCLTWRCRACSCSPSGALTSWKWWGNRNSVFFPYLFQGAELYEVFLVNTALELTSSIRIWYFLFKFMKTFVTPHRSTLGSWFIQLTSTPTRSAPTTQRSTREPPDTTTPAKRSSLWWRSVLTSPYVHSSK